MLSMNYELRITNKARGFTLIELVVVIGILAVLSVFVVTTLNPYEQFLKAQDARRKSDLSQIQKALEGYYQDNGSYPSASPEYKILTNEGGGGGTVKDWGENWNPYMQIIPSDRNDRQYIYNASADGQSYWLYTSLERGAKDPQACNSGLVCTNVPANVTCGSSAICNYGVSSPNVSP